MFVLGLNAYHGDSSACIFQNTTLIAATEEERIRRIKHWAGLPVESIKFCLDEANISIEDVDYITVSRDPKAKFFKKASYALRSGIKLSTVKDRVRNSFSIKSLKADVARELGVELEKIKAEVVYVEHHRSHMASAYYVSPFEESAVLTVDGMGDFTSVMKGYAKGNEIKIFDSVSYPHSLGILYTAFTQFLGFYNYGDEYKVMGLSPYGEAKYLDKVREVLQVSNNGFFELKRDYFSHFSEGVSMSWAGGSPTIGKLFTNKFETLFGKARTKGDELTQYHMDVAASVQKLTEEVIFTLAEDLYKKTGSKNLCLAGGVAQNSVANGKLLANTSFENLFVPPAGHDAGTSVGSALFFIHNMKGLNRPDFKKQAYTGACFTDEFIEDYLKGKEINYERLPESELYDRVSEKLLDAGVIGWFQGRAEFGPRALGNRSILVDPRRSDAKELLNSKIKRRESFRPFAPSILKEYTEEYFEFSDDVPFMEKVYKIKSEKHSAIPAVTHVDGTGRLQTVEKADNERYHKLISAFNEKSGVPILLNTSFNENEPIVNTPEHALDCFLRTKMDMLVLGNCVVTRETNEN